MARTDALQHTGKHHGSIRSARKNKQGKDQQASRMLQVWVKPSKKGPIKHYQDIIKP
jgi:hypothetical protein